MMEMNEPIVWSNPIAPDGREVVTVGTPQFPVQMWGRWNWKGTLREVPCHWHEELELNLTTEGRELVLADGKSILLEAGQGVFVNSGVLHGSRTAPGCKGFQHNSVLFRPTLVGGASGSVYWQRYVSPVLRAPECRCIPLRGETDWERQVLDQMRRMVQLWEQQTSGYEFAMRDALSQIILLFKENCVREVPVPSAREVRDTERLKQMIDFVRHHQDEDLTTAQIAASASLSVSECLRCFRRMMDLTPKEYLTQHRIRCAATLLEQTGKSIGEIAAECGFPDMSYFARVFRAQRGCTPTEYRARVRGA